MSKLVFLLLIAVAVSANAEADPRFSLEDLFPGGFPSIARRFKIDIPDFPKAPEPVKSAEEIKGLKGDDGSSVSGSFHSESSSYETKNGVPVKSSHHGRTVTNKNGEVEEESF